MPVIEQTAGYWGEVTASVDWCEPNYAWTPFVAEFWNTISSLAMIGVGLMGLVLNRKVMDLAFTFVFASIIMVGIGSTLFHGTLTKVSQWLDEVPMLYVAFALNFILIDSLYKLTPLKRKLLGGFFIVYSIITTLLVTVPEGDNQFLLFHISFGSAEIFCLLQTWRASVRANDPKMKSLFSSGLATFATGVGCWGLDFFFCDYIDGGKHSLLPINPQLHSLWHIITSFGLYKLALVAMSNSINVKMERSKTAKAVKISYKFLGMIPILSFQDKPKHW